MNTENALPDNKEDAIIELLTIESRLAEINGFRIERDPIFIQNEKQFYKEKYVLIKRKNEVLLQIRRFKKWKEQKSIHVENIVEFDDDIMLLFLHFFRIVEEFGGRRLMNEDGKLIYDEVEKYLKKKFTN